MFPLSNKLLSLNYGRVQEILPMYFELYIE